jgi:hypothetical protein
MGYGFFLVRRTFIKHLQYLRCGTFKRDDTRNKLRFCELEFCRIDDFLDFFEDILYCIVLYYIIQIYLK